MKKYFKEIIPPVFYSILNKVLRRRVRWSGPYESWSQASLRCEGYDNDLIIRKTKEAVEQVINGNANYERDSVLFYDNNLNKKYLAALFLANSIKKQREMRVLDFGAGLASQYLQHRSIIDHFDRLEYNIIEQNKFVSIGNDLFNGDKKLNFYESSQEINGTVDLLIFSSVLQYLPNYDKIIDEVLTLKPAVIFVDKTPYDIIAEIPRVYVQKVPANIYKAEYPSLIFNQNTLDHLFALAGYDLFMKFEDQKIEGHKNFFYQGRIYSNINKI